jgi:hypothetical protein
MGLVSSAIENPSVMIGNEKITFPVRMESGMYLEFSSADDCKLYGKKGELIANVVPSGTIPQLFPGENAISFSCEGTKKVNSRVQVTIICEGTPLINAVKIGM